MSDKFDKWFNSKHSATRVLDRTTQELIKNASLSAWNHQQKEIDRLTERVKELEASHKQMVGGTWNNKERMQSLEAELQAERACVDSFANIETWCFTERDAEDAMDRAKRRQAERK